MTEDKFYKMYDACEEIDRNVINTYFPTVSEFEYNLGLNQENLETHLHMVLFFSTDPLSKMPMEPEIQEEYTKTVNYCKEIVSKIMEKLQ